MTYPNADATQLTHDNPQTACWGTNDGYPDDIYRLMLLKDNMDVHAYEIKASRSASCQSLTNDMNTTSHFLKSE